ncbi:hypothetical protein YPPY12_4301, partial [Yersinia pestis PY-12]
MKLIGSLF